MIRKQGWHGHHWLKWLSVLAFSAMTLITSTIFLIIAIKSGKSLTAGFFLDKPRGFPIGSEGGVFPAIAGSLYFTLIAVGFAFLLSLITSIYLEFFCQTKQIKKLLHSTIGALAGVPSILLGLFGYSLLVVNFRLGISLLSGGLVLGAMIFPYMEIRFERIFRDINETYQIRAFSLGVNSLYYIIHIVMPLAWRNLLSTISLVASTAIGAAAPLMLTGAVFYAKVPDSILAPAMALPVHLYNLVAESISVEKAFATAGVLLVLLFILNLVSWLLSYKGEVR